ncbi:MAG: 2-amino-4-hydroxy-6-hydroxymethyldihydropteridine diphosphokinase [Clostridium sp.]|nr:2-amino-4-hydroxy-6-hydroxymethyldihydropteridine diphosphokinase [Clostridium sp.]
MMELCWLCLGCNHGAASAMPRARKQLTDLFGDIRFGTEQTTKPVNFVSSAPFVNQVACFHSAWSTTEIRCRLKEIECTCGRCREDKSKGLVKMDIDLLMYGDTVLKPEDMKLFYIRKGINELKSGQ